MARPGHERFTEPTVAAHRRYEALRAYYVEELSAAEIAERFGYTKASVQTLISTYREADCRSCSRRRARGPSASPRRTPPASGRSSCAAHGTGSRRSSPSLSGRARRCRAPRCGRSCARKGSRRMPKPPRAPKPRAGARAARRREGARARRGGLAGRGQRSRPSTPACSCSSGSWSRSISPGWSRSGRLAVHQPASGDPLGAVAAGAQALRPPPAKPRASVVHDPALGLFAGLNVLPKTWHLTTYSYRTSAPSSLRSSRRCSPGSGTRG